MCGTIEWRRRNSQHGRTSKRGRNHARAMLVEAAWAAAKAPGPPRSFFLRIRARRGHQIAAVAVAHKLARSAGICSARMPTTNGRVRRSLPARSARCSCRLAGRREKAINVAWPMPTTSRNYAIGRSMSRVTLNMPTNTSSADGSRVVLKNGARVPPMRSDVDGCAVGLTSSGRLFATRSPVLLQNSKSSRKGLSISSVVRTLRQ